MAAKIGKKRTPTSPALPPVVMQGYFRALLLMLCFVVLMFLLAGILAVPAMKFFPPNSRDGLIAANIVQNVIAFFGSAVLTSIFLTRKPLAFLGCEGRLRPVTAFNILICIILAYPFINEISYLNAQMRLPAALDGIEAWMRTLEKTAGSQVDMLLGVHSVGGLVVNVLVIGVLTGFCEEIFFRGLLQRLLGSHGVNRHLAVWMAAFIFSLMHFQFFGFLPRLLLGAFFGYIFLWTSSIWACAVAHAIFNSVTIVTVWLANRGIDTSAVEKLGIQAEGFPWVAAISLALSLFFIYIQRRNRLF